MKISRDSWHYQFMSNCGMVDRWSQYTLCQYFWKLVWSILVTILAVGFVMLVVVAVLVVVFCMSVFLLAPFGLLFDFMVKDHNYEFACLVTWTLLIAAVIYGVAEKDIVKREIPWWMKKIIPNAKDKPKPTPVERKPNVFTEYYKAHKAKYCPIIEIVD